MPRKETPGFVVCYSIPSKKWVVLLTKNLTERRAKRLWKKFLRKNMSYPHGLYGVAYKKRQFLIKDVASANN